MNNILTLAVTASLLGGCAHRQPVQQQPTQSAEDVREEKRQLYYKDWEKHSDETRDKALAELGSLQFNTSTLMQRGLANRCVTDPDTWLNDDKHRACIRVNEAAEMSERHEREAYEFKKKKILVAYEDSMSRIAMGKDMDELQTMAKGLYSSSPAYASAPSAGYGYASGNPYGTPSPSLYMAPGPGTSITSFGPDMWTARGTSPEGRATICNGAYGVVSCY